MGTAVEKDQWGSGNFSNLGTVVVLTGGPEHGNNTPPVKPYV